MRYLIEGLGEIQKNHIDRVVVVYNVIVILSRNCRRLLWWWNEICYE